jgi:hypothetical protein
MITCCVRGERFCDGHCGGLIEDGYIRRLLERLLRLAQQRNEVFIFVKEN